MALLNCSLNGTSTLNKDPETKEWKAIGDPTEIALHVFSHKMGYIKEKYSII